MDIREKVVTLCKDWFGTKKWVEMYKESKVIDGVRYVPSIYIAKIVNLLADRLFIIHTNPTKEGYKQCPKCDCIIEADPEYVLYCYNCGQRIEFWTGDPALDYVRDDEGEWIFEGDGERKERRDYEDVRIHARRH